MKHKILALVIAGAFSNLAAAETKSGFELAAGFGKFMYGDGRLKDPTMGVFSVSYLFENSFQIELIGANPDTTFIPK